MLDFFDRIVLYFQKFFCIWKEARIKNHIYIYIYIYIITVQKNFTFLRSADRKNTVFGLSRNLIDKLVFK